MDRVGIFCDSQFPGQIIQRIEVIVWIDIDSLNILYFVCSNKSESLKNFSSVTHYCFQVQCPVRIEKRELLIRF